jgi:DNA-binding beta-propeller fold protein YncE
MRKALVFVLTLLAVGAAGNRAPAREGQSPVGPGDPCVPLARAVLDSFPPPGTVPRGLDWDARSGVLFHCDDDDEGGTVYSIDPDGTATLLFDVSTQTGHRQAGATDLCLVHDDSLDVDYLYVVDYAGGKDTSDIVYQFTLDGTLIEEYPLMGIDPVCSGVMGITFDGEFFWLSCLLTSEIVKCDTEFAAIDTFSHPAGTGGGMDFDPETRRLYVTDFFEGNIYVTNRTLQVVDVFPAHPVAFQMVGVAIGRVERRRTVWTSCYNPNWRYIYEIDDEYYNSAVERMSWGMIKSLYR